MSLSHLYMKDPRQSPDPALNGLNAGAAGHALDPEGHMTQISPPRHSSSEGERYKRKLIRTQQSKQSLFLRFGYMLLSRFRRQTNKSNSEQLCRIFKTQTLNNNYMNTTQSLFRVLQKQHGITKKQDRKMALFPRIKHNKNRLDCPNNEA